MKTLVVLLALAAQEKNEGEELFRKMEEKLLKAKTLSLKVRISTQGERLGRGRLEGSLVLESPKKVHSLLEGRLGVDDRKIQLVSDGKNLKWFLTGFGDSAGAAPDAVGANLALFLSRANLFDGVYMGAALEWAEGGHGAGDRLKVSGFKAGAVEKVEEVEARKIEFRMEAPDLKAGYGVELWIDPKTLLPVKRVLKVLDGQANGMITEVFSEFKVDETVDPAVFKLPS